MRCHGRRLEPISRIGREVPELDELLTERHHPYFGRVNPGVLCAAKCNHDIRVMLTFSPAWERRMDIGTQEEISADADKVASRLACQINNASHYVTDYAGKTQPHMKNLFRLLQIGQERWEQRERDTVALKDRPAFDRAWSVWVRMNMSCLKRVHKSMQEMVSYLLGVPEAFCTHDFRLLYYASMVHSGGGFASQWSSHGYECGSAHD